MLFQPQGRLSREANAFCRALFSDLRPLGYVISGSGARLVVRQELDLGADPRTLFRAAHEQLMRVRIQADSRYITKFENEFGKEIFIEGAAVELSAISPKLRIATLQGDGKQAVRDRAIVTYFRRYQTVESRMSVGRENIFILEDVGQASTKVMGVLVLASPRWFSPRRDEVLGWTMPHQETTMSPTEKRRCKELRMFGLDRMMHVAVCCTVPPYSTLGAAKLLATAPFTTFIQGEFTSRWKSKPDLALVTTTCSMGRTGTPFQRLVANRLFDQRISPTWGATWNREGRLYRRLGNEHPWKSGIPIQSPEPLAGFSALVTPETHKIARKFVKSIGAKEVPAGKVLGRAISELGLGREIFDGNPVGVFVGAIDLPSVLAISTGQTRTTCPSLSWELAVRKFRSDFGEDVELIKIREDGVAARRDAIERRRLRAKEIAMADIMLSSRSLSQSVDDAE
jgi:hypothetical protein